MEASVAHAGEAVEEAASVTGSVERALELLTAVTQGHTQAIRRILEEEDNDKEEDEL